MFDVIIIGSGFFGTCTALLLSKQGYCVTLVTEGQKPLDFGLNSLNTLWPSLNDPPTRADVAHGHEVACYLNEYCHLGVDFFYTQILPQYAQSDHWLQAPCLRIGLQTFEQEELEKAKKLGFGLAPTDKKEIYREKNPSFVCENPDLFQEEMLTSLQKNSVNVIQQSVVSLKEEQNKCYVTLNNNKTILESEIVVLGNGASISSLLPRYKSILVPMSDILVEYECETQKKCEPVTFRISNGHIAVSLFTTKNKTILKMTGPRFLLPQAGVGLIINKEDISPALLSKVTKGHAQIFSVLASYYGYASVEFFLNDFPFKQTNYSAHADCHPCDELPLVGEFGRLGRVLGSTGFLATGFSAGAWSAKIICDLICQQKSEFLHERLQPRRFNKMFNS